MSSRGRVCAAVVAVAGRRARCVGGPAASVRAFHVRHFGIEACTRDLAISTIDGHLRALAAEGRLRRVGRGAEYLPASE